MRVLMVSLSVLALAACGGRQVEVRTGPEPATDVSLHLTNNLSQAVNVYVVSGGNDIFLKQVAANSVENVPVAGVPAGCDVRIGLGGPADVAGVVISYGSTGGTCLGVTFSKGDGLSEIRDLRGVGA